MGLARNLARLIVDGSGAINATNLTNAVPADGSITEAKLASDSVTAAKIATGAVGTSEIAAGAVVEADIADGAVTTNKLANSGVTAGSYGTSSAIPAITVDAKGRITSATTNSFTSGISAQNCSYTGSLVESGGSIIYSAFGDSYNVTLDIGSNRVLTGVRYQRTSGCERFLYVWIRGYNIKNTA
jgi:hypothetical protein